MNWSPIFGQPSAESKALPTACSECGLPFLMFFRRLPSVNVDMVDQGRWTRLVISKGIHRGLSVLTSVQVPSREPFLSQLICDVSPISLWPDESASLRLLPFPLKGARVFGRQPTLYILSSKMSEMKWAGLKKHKASTLSKSPSRKVPLFWLGWAPRPPGPTLQGAVGGLDIAAHSEPVLNAFN